MARLDVYKNLGTGRAKAPYVVDVQNQHIGDFGRRVVVPMIRVTEFPQDHIPQDLSPQFTVEGIDVMLHPVFMASVPNGALGQKVGSLTDTRAENAIITALDRLFGRY